MAHPEFTRLIEDLSQNTALADRLQAVETPEALLRLLGEAGYDIPEDELRAQGEAALARQEAGTAELPLRELDGVAGGHFGDFLKSTIPLLVGVVSKVFGSR
ncbi:Nif11-like leader peptide family RiPP precursor [Pseudoroseomonas cervicalis]|uniref:Bacteriocin propeptide, TIGR03798 family n=1 Tax=Pseudoroseomonas cervicalis ATCC 49957 TaxID=525371 RepID=D5RUE7_9PROT|nr:Nif11-like leader peptide family RiPP precursor [Pseudoroseomonas cervicalis]EFH09073.1 bacteriocin propeptide, TIGR03798 family [Pseudoroseomonas cervicalis ATCC 49957]